MYNETHNIILTKQAQRSLRDKVIENNITALLASVNGKSLAVRGWMLERSAEVIASTGRCWGRQSMTSEEGYEWGYDIVLSLTFQREDDKQPSVNEAASIIRTLAVRSVQPSFGKWAVTRVDGISYTQPDDDEISSNVNRDLVGYADVLMPDDDEWNEAFSHLFGLDSHIARVRSALLAGADSGWRNRFHAALIGPPGCGKSDIGATIRQALGEDAVMQLDATATTAAGAIKELSEREILPRVIVIEEIEKAPEAAMSFLLGVLDQRSEIRKTTARGTIQRDTKLFAIATVNDVALFRKLQAGALASRFPNTIFFSRPSRETLSLILTREVSKVDGNHEWIEPTLNYCQDHGITDPRTVISLCLCGRDDLLSGIYQKMLDETGEYTDDQGRG
jgi:hypothetical protein